MRKFSLMILVAATAAFTGCRFGDLLLDPGSTQGSKGARVPFETVAMGQGNGIVSFDPNVGNDVNNRGQILITDEARWREIWEQLTRGTTPQEELPKVDFNTSALVAVFQGRHGSGGHMIEVTNVSDGPTSLNVSFNETGPGPGCFVTMAFTAPYHIIKIGRPSKPLEYSSSSIVKSCD